MCYKLVQPRFDGVAWNAFPQGCEGGEGGSVGVLFLALSMGAEKASE